MLKSHDQIKIEVFMRFFRLPRRPKMRILLPSILIVTSLAFGISVTSEVVTPLSGAPKIAAAPAITPKIKPTAAQLKVSKVSNRTVSQIAANETWSRTKAGVYIVNGVVTVPKGKTLTIAAGTIVKYKTSQSRLVAEAGATISVSGSASNPVIFSSIKDDTVGGDSNGDKAATKPGSNDYAGAILVYGGSSIKYALIRNTAQPVTISSNGVGATANAPLYVTDSVLYGELALEDTKAKMATIARNQFIASSSNAMRVQYSDVTGIKLAGVDSNIIEGTGRAKAVLARHSVVPAGKTWDVSGLSKHVLVVFNLDIDGKVNLKDGAVIKNTAQWNGVDYGLRINQTGVLNVSFTANSRVIFAAYSDDSVAGDTNGDGSTPKKADGMAIQANGGSINLAKVDIKSLGHLSLGCNSLTKSISIADSMIASNIDIGFCKKGQYSLKRNVFSVPATQKALGLYHTDVEGFVTTGADKNTFGGANQSRVVHLNAVTLNEGSKWMLSAEPNAVYQVEQFAVSGDLEVKPGVIVKTGIIRDYQAIAHAFDIKGKGTLTAVGSALNPITFTSLSDDTVGGDSGADGSTQGTPYDYPSMLNANSSGAIKMAFTNIRHTRFGVAVTCSGEGSVSLTDSRISSPVHIDDCNSPATSIKRNVFDITHGIPLHLNKTYLANVTLDGVDSNRFLGNGSRQVVRISSELSPGVTWNVSGKSGAVLVAAGFKVKGNLNLKDGQVVKIIHGVWPYQEIFFMAEDNARITMNGTASQPITITDIADKSVGGDSQADAGQPYSDSLGHLFGLGVGGNARVDGSFVNSRHAGYAFRVYGEGAELDLRNSTITQSTVALAVDAGVATYRGSIKNMSGTDALIKSCDWDTTHLCSVDVGYVDWGPGGVKIGNEPDAVCGRLSVSPWKVGNGLVNGDLYDIENCSGRPKPRDVLASAAAYYQQQVAKRQIDCSYGIQDACDAIRNALKCYAGAANIATNYYNVPIKVGEPQSASEAITTSGQIAASAAEVMVNAQEQDNPSKFNLKIANGLLGVVGVVKSLSDAYGSCSP